MIIVLKGPRGQGQRWFWSPSDCWCLGTQSRCVLYPEGGPGWTNRAVDPNLPSQRCPGVATGDYFLDRHSAQEDPRHRWVESLLNSHSCARTHMVGFLCQHSCLTVPLQGLGTFQPSSLGYLGNVRGPRGAELGLCAAELGERTRALAAKHGASPLHPLLRPTVCWAWATALRGSLCPRLGPGGWNLGSLPWPGGRQPHWCIPRDGPITTAAPALPGCHPGSSERSPRLTPSLWHTGGAQRCLLGGRN